MADPHFKIEKDDHGRSRMLRRTADGEWEVVESPPVSLNDEVNAMGELDYEELEAIVQDPDDSRHDLASEYLRLSGDQLREAMMPLTRRLNEQWKDLFKDLTFKPLITPNPSMPQSPPPNPPRDPSVTADDSLDDEGDDAPGSQVPEEGPASLAEGLQELLHLQRQQNAQQELSSEAATADSAKQQDLLRQQITQAKLATEDQRQVADDERESAKSALRAAWVAVAVTVMVGLGQIAIGILTFICSP